MKLEKKALIFANYAHFGQERKAEPDKPYIVHPVHVASLLKQFGFDSNVIAAGFLHDVVEDTNYRLDDIQKLFGSDVLSLVDKATQSDKSKTWESRKLQAIEDIRYQDFRHKAVVCADKISNLDDIRILFGKKGQYDFSAFRRGYNKQKWYYESIYQSLIVGGYEKHMLFIYLRQLIDEVFYSDQTFLYSNLEYQKQELSKLKRILKTQEIYGEIHHHSLPILDFSLEKRRNKILDKIEDATEKIKKLQL